MPIRRIRSIAVVSVFAVALTGVYAEHPIDVVTVDVEQSLDAEADAQGGRWWVSDQPIDDVRAYAREELERLEEKETDLPAGDRWEAVTVPGDLSGRAGYDSGEGTFWYRRLIILPERVDRSVGLRLGRINDADRVYFNGEEIAGTGAMDSDRPQAYDRIRIYEVPPYVLRAGQPNLLLVQVKRYSPGQTGIFGDRTAIGPAQAMLRGYYLDRIVDLWFIVVYLTVGVYFLYLFFRRLKDREYLFYGLFTLVFVGYLLLRSQLRFDFDLNFYLSKRLEYILLFFLVPTFYYFIRYYYDFPDTKLYRVLHWIGHAVNAFQVLAVLYILIEPYSEAWWVFHQMVVLPLGWLPTFLLILFFLINRLVAGIRSVGLWQSGDAALMLAGFVCILAAFVSDNLVLTYSLQFPLIFRYVFLIFVASLGGIMANRYVRVNKEVEDLNKNLEKKVQDRTAELRNTLSRVRELKEAQDGDYFLTSLLIRPLGGNNVVSVTVSIEMFTAQKKKFSFRHWNSEIGGDLSVAHSIQLRDRRFTVFMNGDAMGKSIQGAGGALVLGTVFKSLITRSIMSSRERETFPEQWLRMCYLELQSVFESFDGHMLISGVFGLIDDDAGLMYYINAEHPPVALYRNGRASFIEEDSALRKLGWTDEKEEFYIRLFALERDDVIYLGTDGRDDLMISNEAGQQAFNEDHQLFLRSIEKADGLISGTVDNLVSAGQLTDDISLMRIAFKEDFPIAEAPEETDEYRRAMTTAAQAIQNDAFESAAADLERALAQKRYDTVATKRLIRVYLKTRKNLERACELCEEYLALHPEDSDFLLVSARAFQNAGQHELAADYCERFRLRFPNNPEGLIRLSDIYRRAGNLERAIEFLERASKIVPEDARVQRLRELLA